MTIVGNCNRAHLRIDYNRTYCGLDCRFYETTDNIKEVDCKNCLRIEHAKKLKGQKNV